MKDKTQFPSIKDVEDVQIIYKIKGQFYCIKGFEHIKTKARKFRIGLLFSGLSLLWATHGLTKINDVMTKAKTAEQPAKKEDMFVPTRCVNCKHWKNNQAELDYSSLNGICTSPKLKFDIDEEGGIMVLDRAARSPKYMGVNRFESLQLPLQVEKSRYVLVTEEMFGCVNYENKD